MNNGWGGGSGYNNPYQPQNPYNQPNPYLNNQNQPFTQQPYNPYANNNPYNSNKNMGGMGGMSNSYGGGWGRRSK